MPPSRRNENHSVEFSNILSFFNSKSTRSAREKKRFVRGGYVVCVTGESKKRVRPLKEGNETRRLIIISQGDSKEGNEQHPPWLASYRERWRSENAGAGILHRIGQRYCFNHRPSHVQDNLTA